MIQLTIGKITACELHLKTFFEKHGSNTLKRVNFLNVPLINEMNVTP